MASPDKGACPVGLTRHRWDPRPLTKRARAYFVDTLFDVNTIIGKSAQSALES